MTKTKKLYRVELRGMTYNTTGPARGISFVIATNPDEAYQKVKTYLDEKDYGFTQDRQLKAVELIAEAYDYTDVGTILHL